MKPIHLLLNSANGVYIPKIFAEHLTGDWSGVRNEDLATLLQGPEAEGYWEAWDSTLTHAIFTEDQLQYRLYQEGDLWLWCPDLMTWQGHQQFFGEAPEVCVTMKKYGDTLALRYTYGDTDWENDSAFLADFTLLSEVGEPDREAATEAREALLKRLGATVVDTDIGCPPWVVEKVVKL